jgi:hypothetical protein
MADNCAVVEKKHEEPTIPVAQFPVVAWINSREEMFITWPAGQANVAEAV